MSGYNFLAVRALIFDSTHHSSDLLAGMLRMVGFRQITIASSASVFAQDVGRGGYGIAFIGDQQTNSGGVLVVAGIRANEASSGFYTPIVMLFSDTSQRHIMAARDAGVTDFIRKPVSPAILALRIEQVFTRPQPGVASTSYSGPDRRRRNAPFKGGDRRGD